MRERGMGVRDQGNKADLGTKSRKHFFIVDTGTYSWIKPKKKIRNLTHFLGDYIAKGATSPFAKSL